MQRLPTRVLRTAAPVVSRVLRALPLGERIDAFLLRQIWSRGSAEMLDSYLVSGYQNPRINVQSILLRHFLVRRVFGPGFDELMDEELRFAVELNEALRVSAAELGVVMGSYLDPAKQAAVRRAEAAIAGRETEFEGRWRAALAGRSATRASVLELACGSANDYRAFAAYGIADHLDYRGVDLTEKNIANARRRHPGVAFEVADIVDLRYPDASFDYVVASDIFEHLSVENMERALGHAVRLARRGLALTFFNMHDGPDHDVRLKGAYHWNRLSRPVIEEHLRRHGADVSVVAVHAFLKERFGYSHTYNRHAYSMFADVGDPGGTDGAGHATLSASEAVGR
jgi:SAM-dependent methyltransferase